MRGRKERATIGPHRSRGERESFVTERRNLPHQRHASRSYGVSFFLFFPYTIRFYIFGGFPLAPTKKKKDKILYFYFILFSFRGMEKRRWGKVWDSALSFQPTYSSTPPIWSWTAFQYPPSSSSSPPSPPSSPVAVTSPEIFSDCPPKLPGSSNHLLPTTTMQGPGGPS